MLEIYEAWLRVHTFDPAMLRSTSQLQQLKAVAEAVARSCPEATAWLNSAEASASLVECHAIAGAKQQDSPAKEPNRVA